MSTISSSTTSSTAYKVTADTTGTLVLQTGATPTTAMTIDGSQNVGIGTTSPSSSMASGLHIASSGGNSLILQKSTGATMQFRSDATTIRASITGLNGADGISFAYGASQTEAMRIDSSGNLLVGTTSNPGVGKIGIQFSQSTNQAIALQNTSASNSGNYINFYNSSGTLQGYIGQTNSTTTAYVTSSDYRLKENVQPMTSALAKVTQLKPCTYIWKDNGFEGEGFIAHELAEVCPHAVMGEKDAVDAEGNPQYQGIDTSFLVATLTAAIQEQQALITQLQADVAALKG